jgi:D-alanyl-lipoteichoic acid acyltransferase DltB (MBOAT superfamily)
MINVHGKLVTCKYMLHGLHRCLLSSWHILPFDQMLAWLSMMHWKSNVMSFMSMLLVYEVRSTIYDTLASTDSETTESNFSTSITQKHDEAANLALICQGLLGTSSLQPTVAFTLESLEFYHQLRRCQANFSVQAFINVLCAIHNVSPFQCKGFF